MQGENANKIHYVYKVMVVQHICNSILGIPSPGYPGNKIQILMPSKFDKYIMILPAPSLLLLYDQMLVILFISKFYSMAK